MQHSLHEVDTCRKAESNKLLTDFLRREVAFLICVPRFKDLLSKVHVVNLLNQVHASVLMALNPLLDVLSDQVLLIVHANQGFLLVLIVKVSHDLK